MRKKKAPSSASREIARSIPIESRRVEFLEIRSVYFLESLRPRHFEGSIVFFSVVAEISDAEVEALKRRIEAAGAVRAKFVGRENASEALPEVAIEKIKSASLRDVARAFVEKVREDIRIEVGELVELALSNAGI